ncbi:hypothetical protein F2Q70_00027603 [Brassica cretica]|uniref:Uncharacterized protein n=1 Tax=Brassica cretica TaxID=69181 RepID=A0A8S9L1Q3_BRACR|nr:hypothetical protein F2Q70_00027603 [Brassica cretica]
MKTGNEVCEPSTRRGDSADEESKRNSASAEPAKAKRPRYEKYRAKISVYDNSEQAFFVLLGNAGRELTGRHASELVTSYFEANEYEGADHEVPVPEALISTIGQTHKFCVKVTEHNFSGNTQAITVTKILSLDTPPPT